jgi:predicted phage-related endonuclease
LVSATKRSIRSEYFSCSDAYFIVDNNEAALPRLWREKRGEVEPEDLSGNLGAQFGLAAEDLSRQGFQQWSLAGL